MTLPLSLSLSRLCTPHQRTTDFCTTPHQRTTD